MNLEAVKEPLRERRSYECPGGGLTPYQELGDMLSGYEWNWEPFEAEAPPSDEALLQKLIDQGRDVLSSVRGKSPSLPNLHDVPDLQHMGVGDSADERHHYRRIDSPRGMRFDIREEKA